MNGHHSFVIVVSFVVTAFVILVLFVVHPSRSSCPSWFIL